VSTGGRAGRRRKRARRLDVLPGSTVCGRYRAPGRRSPGDCLRAAVATVLGMTHDDTPPISAYDAQASLKCGRGRLRGGLLMSQNLSHGAAFLDEPWIAVAVGQAELHAVVMRRGPMIFDSSPGSPQQAFGRGDVQAS
jgi:hypothetical protein